MHSRWNRIHRGRSRNRYIVGVDGSDGTVNCVELPDFHLPHAEKIEWMVETDGFAVEPVPPDPDADPPQPAYTYTIGFPTTPASRTSWCSG